jgi:hypothetical protein
VLAPGTSPWLASVVCIPKLLLNEIRAAHILEKKNQVLRNIVLDIQETAKRESF